MSHLAGAKSRNRGAASLDEQAWSARSGTTICDINAGVSDRPEHIKRKIFLAVPIDSARPRRKLSNVRDV
jgi:hypothetical protein